MPVRVIVPPSAIRSGILGATVPADAAAGTLDEADPVPAESGYHREQALPCSVQPDIICTLPTQPGCGCAAAKYAVWESATVSGPATDGHIKARKPPRRLRGMATPF